MKEREFWERCAVAAVEAFAPLIKQTFSGDSLSQPIPAREITTAAALIADSMGVEWRERFNGGVRAHPEPITPGGKYSLPSAWPEIRPRFTAKFGELAGEPTPDPTYTRAEFERDQLGQTGDGPLAAHKKICIACLGETDAKIGVPETRCPQCGRRIIQQLQL